MSQIDFYRSLASLVGVDVPSTEAIDSQNILPALLDINGVGRKMMLEESFTLSLRENNWKYIAPFSGVTPGWLANKTVENGLSTEAQLFDLSTDLQEKNNIISQHPDIAARLAASLTDIINKE